MIVFTATNRRTQQVFVGKAQESVDEEWAHMLAQAEIGAEGAFFDLVRENASDFNVETWAYAETPAETRESFREAREDLNAVVIKLPRSRPSNSNAQPIRSASMKALMDSIHEAGEGSDCDDEESLLSPEENPLDPNTPKLMEGGVTAPVEGEVQALSDEERLQARINAMKAAQAKVLSKQTAKSGRSVATPKVSTAKTKLANGRTGSAIKEQRIREGIESDKEKREAFRAQSNLGQQAEMNALMARVEMRRTAHKVKKQDEAKKRAAAAAREKKAAEKAELQIKKEAKKLREQAEKQLRAVTGKQIPAQTLSQEQAEALITQSRSLDAAEAQVAKAAPVLEAVIPAEAGKSKEERVREGMAQQRAARVVQRRAQANQEADEMSSLLARLDSGSRSATRRGNGGKSSES